MEQHSIGIYGPLPDCGERIKRRLPDSFVTPWSNWLQSALETSQKALQADWLQQFMNCPVWRFALSPGLCGDQAWAGIMIASTDVRGAHFPLTLVQPVGSEQIGDLFGQNALWFEALEQAAYAVSSGFCTFEEFEQGLGGLVLPESSLTQTHSDSAATHAYRIDLPSLADAHYALAALAPLLLNRAIEGGYSLWACDGGQFGQPNFLYCQGLPPPNAYTDFLAGVPGRARFESCAAYKLTPPHLSPDFEDQDDEVDYSNWNIVSHWQAHGLSEIGRHRAHNQDAILNATELGFWCVADGMGGHLYGDVASNQIIETLAALPPACSLVQGVEWICDYLHRVNEQLLVMAQKLSQGGVIGSTVVCMLARANQCAVIWAGDSRLYRYRHGQLSQLTRDHTLADELLAASDLSREAVLQHIDSNVITRAVGGSEILDLDVLRFHVEAGDRYLLCSDGLLKELSEAEIAECLKTEIAAESAAGALMSLALSREAVDNISVLVVQCEEIVM
jgi:type VI secretion system protein ImpM